MIACTHFFAIQLVISLMCEHLVNAGRIRKGHKAETAAIEDMIDVEKRVNQITRSNTLTPSTYRALFVAGSRITIASITLPKLEK